MTRKHILSLPIETQVGLLRSLGFKDLISCQLVCRAWRLLIQGSDELQYRIELSLHGLEDDFSGTWSMQERLKKLQDTQTAWYYLRWGDKVHLATTARDRIWLEGDILTYRHPSRPELCFRRFKPGSSAVEELALKISYHDREDKSAVALDPSQDLVVLASLTSPMYAFGIDLEFRSLSSGSLHPLASKTRSVPPVEGEDAKFLTMQVVGSFVGIHVKYAGLHLTGLFSAVFIWNWKTGESQMNLYGAEWDWSFTFIDETRILLAVSECWPLVDPPPSSYEGYGIIIVDVTMQDDTWRSYDEAVSARVFLLPPPSLLHDQPSATYFTSLSRFRTSSSASAISSPAALSLFQPRNADQLIYLCAGEAGMEADVDSGSISLELFIAVSKLLAKFTSASDPISPWAAWSECVVSASMCPSFDRSTSAHCVAGMRLVEPHPVLTEDGPSFVVMKDCNVPRLVRRGAPSTTRCAEDRDFIRPGAWADEEIRVERPRELRAVPLPEGISDTSMFMIGDEALFVVDQYPSADVYQVYMLPFTR